MIGKKATLQATRVIHTCRKESLFFFANKLDKVLIPIMLVVLSGFKIMGKIEMAGAMFPQIFVLKLPVAKAKVPKQKRHVSKAVSHKTYTRRAQKAGRKSDTRCVICVFYLLNPMKWCKQT